MIRTGIRFGLLALALLVRMIAAPDAGAQEPDSAAAAPEYFTAQGPLARLHLAPYADLVLWSERVEQRPGTSTALTRRRATLRAGLEFGPRGRWPFEARAGLRASLASDRNPEGRAAFDNMAGDTIEIDQLVARLATPGGASLAAGRMRSPLALTELIWDGDLRPFGVALGGTVGGDRPLSLRMAGAAFTRSRASDADARVAAVQAAVRREGADAGVEAIVSYLGFGHVAALPVQGFARQNTLAAGPGGPAFATSFEIVDLQLGAGRRRGIPVTVRIEVARNRAAPRDRDALRTRLALGGSGAPLGLEAGWVFQRVERDAVCDAFNSDDWWFHSRARGHLLWGAIGIGHPWTARVSSFLERRDDLARGTRRFRLELLARLP